MGVITKAVWFLAGVVVAISIQSHSQTRLELSAGYSHHRLAPEGSWWYDGFQNTTELTTPTWQAGLLWTPWKRGSYRLGFRGGYADLGTVKASNGFPVFEDRSQNDARVNPNCDRQTLSGCTGMYNGRGPTKGWFVGPAIERDFGDFTLGGELGFFRYHAKWVATEWRVSDSQGEFVPSQWLGMQWNEIDKVHYTWYAGANARWKYFFLQSRVYAQVHAADTEKSYQHVGPTSGPLWTVTAGVSLPL